MQFRNLLLVLFLFGACMFISCGSSTSETPQEAAVVQPAAVDTPVAEQKEEVKAMVIPDTLVINVDTPNIIHTLDKTITISAYAEGPTITQVLIDYWEQCYNEQKKLPSFLVVKYENEKMKVFKTGISTGIEDAQMRVMTKLGNRANNYPILLQKKF